MDKVYLILDIGTGNSRAALVNSQGKILGINTFENVYYRDFAYEDAQYFLPPEWKEKLLFCTKQLLEAFPDVQIAAVTSTSARESIVLLDAQGKAFYGLPNIDNRGAAWADKILEPEEIYRKTGRWVSPVFSALKLTGLAKVHREIYERTAGITSLSDWAGYLFTGNLVMEETQACETQLYDIGRHEWSRELCSRFSVDPVILPQVVRSGSCLGKISQETARYLGLPPNTIFLAGGADTQTAVKGIQAEHGEIAVISGTTSPIVTVRDEKFYDYRQRCWTDCYLDKDRYQVETNAGVSGLNYQRLKKLFFPQVSYEELDRRMAEKDRIRCVASFGTLIFSQNKSLSQGGFYMQAPLDAGCDRYDFAFACMGDIVCSIYEEYKNLTTLLPSKGDFILGCGGGFQSQVLCRLLCDLTGKKLVLVQGYDQASLLGCMRVCSQALGEAPACVEIYREYKPEKNAVIRDYYEKWKYIRKLIN